MKVTILSASTGNGHMSAAYALEAVMKEQDIQVATYDALKFAPFAFRTWYGGGYEFIVRTRPSLYGHLYHVSDENKFSYKVQTASDYVFMSRLRKLLKEERPDWVVCTHSLPQPRLAQLREELGFFRIAVVVTDLYPHLMWLRGAPDHYYVPTEWTQELLLQRRAALKGRITVTGIPVNPVFSKTYELSDIQRELGWDGNRPVVVLTSGGIGGGPFEEALDSLLKQNLEIHLEVICGRNEAKRKAIQKFVSEQSQGKSVVQVRGHISQEQMAMRMQIASLFISKPGGLTTSECLTMGTAMLVYEPFLIPGQEEGNADFLVTSGSGAKARGAEELGTLTRELIGQPDRIAMMRATAKGFGKPYAANDIVAHLVEQN